MSKYDILNANYELLNAKYQTLKIENIKLMEQIDKRKISDKNYGYSNAEKIIISMQESLERERIEAGKLLKWLDELKPNYDELVVKNI